MMCWPTYQMLHMHNPVAAGQPKDHATDTGNRLLGKDGSRLYPRPNGRVRDAPGVGRSKAACTHKARIRMPGRRNAVLVLRISAGLVGVIVGPFLSGDVTLIE